MATHCGIAYNPRQSTQDADADTDREIRMRKIEAIIKPFKLDDVKEALGADRRRRA